MMSSYKEFEWSANNGVIIRLNGKNYWRSKIEIVSHGWHLFELERLENLKFQVYIKFVICLN